MKPARQPTSTANTGSRIILATVPIVIPPAIVEFAICLRVNRLFKKLFLIWQLSFYHSNNNK